MELSLNAWNVKAIAQKLGQFFVGPLTPSDNDLWKLYGMLLFLWVHKPVFHIHRSPWAFQIMPDWDLNEFCFDTTSRRN